VSNLSHSIPLPRLTCIRSLCAHH